MPNLCRVLRGTGLEKVLIRPYTLPGRASSDYGNVD